MKKRFNIYCVLMMIIIIVSLVGTVISFFFGVFLGYSQSASGMENEKPYSVQMVSLSPKSDKMLTFGDSIFNAQTHETVGMAVHSASIQTSTELSSSPLMFVNAALAICLMVSLTWVLILFMKILKGVNRNEIFCEKLEKRLARCGWLIIISYFLKMSFSVIAYIEAEKCFAFENYDVTLGNVPSILTLLAGLGLLVVSEIFVMGRKLKEEQELTI